MPNIRWSRAIDVPSRDLQAIAVLLSDLARRECPGIDEEIDYTAGMEVFDTDTGAVVVWTATFPAATPDEADVRKVGVAVFRDFAEQLEREVNSARTTLGQAS